MLSIWPMKKRRVAADKNEDKECIASDKLGPRQDQSFMTDLKKKQLRFVNLYSKKKRI